MEEEIFTVNIRRYRDQDDSGVGLSDDGKLIIVKDMNGEADIVAAQVVRRLEETIIAKRVSSSALQNKAASAPSQGVKRRKTSVYSYADEDDDDDDEDEDDEF